MSYDLMVFEPAAAPKRHAEFLDWYGEQTEWREGKTYDDPSLSSPRLQGWLADIFKLYPPVNGLNSVSELPEDEASLADYSIGEQIVYVCFAWSKAQSAYEDVFRLAGKHCLGFFNVSSPKSEVWLPSGVGLRLSLQEQDKTVLDRIRKLFSGFIKLP